MLLINYDKCYWYNQVYLLFHERTASLIVTAHRKASSIITVCDAQINRSRDWRSTSVHLDYLYECTYCCRSFGDFLYPYNNFSVIILNVIVKNKFSLIKKETYMKRSSRLILHNLSSISYMLKLRNCATEEYIY